MLIFPEDYFHFQTKEIGEGKSNNKSDSIIDVWVMNCLEYLENHPEKQCYSIAQGNTKVIALRYDSEIQVIVAKDYWEKNIYPDR